MFLVREVAVLPCPYAKPLHAGKKAALPLIRRPAGISPDFYTEIGNPSGITTKPARKGALGNICGPLVVFFELDLKINISLFTNYEINVLVWSGLFRISPP
ncbi:hypothetical protein SPRA44_760121 [Serratia proteamaculans]|nr:hypothetical protein SPRA44_760121 [Serratia proteamaculans]